MVQTQMINTVQEVRKNNELFQAKTVAQSVSNFVSYVVDKHDAGFSLEPVECKYVGGKLANGSQNPLCVADSYFDTIAQRQWAKGNNISIKIDVKGHQNSDKKSSKYGECVGGLSTCYGVPAPATGDAGNETLCKAYKESLSATALTNANSSISSANTQPMSDIENPCNWNKLTFGSNLTDRVAIPLYYDSSLFSSTAKLSDLKDISVKDKDIKMPFENGDKNFILRVRAPCLPCFDKDPKTGEEITTQAGKRSCIGLDISSKPKSPYYCTNVKDRYVLDTSDTTEKDISTHDDMVVSWQITGQCDDNKDGTYDNECGMIPVKGIDIDPSTKKQTKAPGFSAIIESLINDNFSKYIIMDTTTTNEIKKPRAKDTSNYAETPKLILDNLKTMTKPVFSMFLSGKLIGTTKGQFVPYLEYQFLTDTPVGQAKIESEVTVIINNVFYTQKLEKAEKRPLIDFAIQN